MSRVLPKTPPRKELSLSKLTITIPALALLSLIGVSQAAAQDAVAGEKVFKIQCMACHSPVTGKNGVGPSLTGV